MMNKIKNNYKSFLSFLAKLVLWVFILAWITPFLAGLFLNTFNKSANLTVGDFVLFITAAFIIAYSYETQKMREQMTEQTKATKKMTEYQLMPSVDVNMVYEKQVGRTYFWFSNTSNIPAIVSFGVSEEKDKKLKQIHNQSLYMPPQQKRRTSIVYNFNLSAEKKLILDVNIKSAYKNLNTEIEFTKSYRFHPDLHRWDEISWGCPDPEWPEKS